MYASTFEVNASHPFVSFRFYFWLYVVARRDSIFIVRRRRPRCVVRNLRRIRARRLLPTHCAHLLMLHQRSQPHKLFPARVAPKIPVVRLIPVNLFAEISYALHQKSRPLRTRVRVHVSSRLRFVSTRWTSTALVVSDRVTRSREHFPARRARRRTSRLDESTRPAAFAHVDALRVPIVRVHPRIREHGAKREQLVDAATIQLRLPARRVLEVRAHGACSPPHANQLRDAF